MKCPTPAVTRFRGYLKYGDLRVGLMINYIHVILPAVSQFLTILLPTSHQALIPY